MNNFFVCKRDIWFNRPADHNIELMDTLYTVSSQLGFEKKYEHSELVFEKHKTYRIEQHITGVTVYSTLQKSSYYFNYGSNVMPDIMSDSCLYFFSAFLPIKWERKLKIKKLLKDNL